MLLERRHRVLNVLAAVDAAREAHAELALPLNWNRLERVFARERIQILRLPIESNAYVIGRAPVFTVILNSNRPARHHTRYAAHEYGHIALHFAQRGEVEKNLAPCQRGDPREWEAELFALMLRLGPEATIETPDVAAMAAKITAADFRKRVPAQLDLPLAEGTPAYRPPSKRFGHGSHNPDAGRDLRRTPKGQRPRMAGSSIGLGVSHDSLLFDWSRDGKPLRYFHLELGWLDVYDLLSVSRGGHRRIVTLECGDRRAECRMFVVSSTDRRRYVFAEGEKRDRSPKALDRQIATSERLAASAQRNGARTKEPRS
ncbi:MAG: ImmA/IrrE family metallo-endopeptidase [Gemmatimonadales bacterium]